MIAVGRNNGKEVCRQILRTPEKQEQLKLTMDRQTLKADGEDISFIRIDILDKNGTFVPDAREKLHVQVTGKGKLKGLCSGDPASHESEHSDTMFTFSGSLLAIVQSSDEAGEIQITVSGENVKTATATLYLE